MRFDEVVTFAFSLEDVIEVGMTKWAGPDGPARPPDQKCMGRIRKFSPSNPRQPGPDSFLLFSSTPLHPRPNITLSSLLFSSTPLHPRFGKPETTHFSFSSTHVAGEETRRQSAGHSRRHHRTAIHDDSDGHHHREDTWTSCFFNNLLTLQTLFLAHICG